LETSRIFASHIPGSCPREKPVEVLGAVLILHAHWHATRAGFNDLILLAGMFKKVLDSD